MTKNLSVNPGPGYLSFRQPSRNPSPVFIFHTLYSLFFSPSHSHAATLSKPANNLGLVGYWSFNEGTSTLATDFSGNGNSGTLYDNSSWTNGRFGKALLFDGSGDYVDLGAPPSLNLQSANKFTLSAWVMPTSDPSASGIVGEY